MKRKMFGLITFLLLGLCFPTFIFAEIIILKSGRQIEGKIIEKTDKYIKIDFYGVPIPYYFEDIDRIVEEEPEPRKIDTANIVEDDDWYANKKFMFKIKKMPKWEFREGEAEGLPEQVEILTLGFLKQPEGGDLEGWLTISVSKMPNPALIGGRLRKGDKFVALADKEINSLTKDMANPRFIQEPTTLNINDIAFRKAVVENQTDEASVALIMLSEAIEINSDIVTLVISSNCKSEKYPTLRPDIEASVQSIEIGK